MMKADFLNTIIGFKCGGIAHAASLSQPGGIAVTGWVASEKFTPAVPTEFPAFWIGSEKIKTAPYNLLNIKILKSCCYENNRCLPDGIDGSYHPASANKQTA